MIGGLILLHRWLGIAFCLLFAMWFATGIVMHFVPFPSLTESERFAGHTPVHGASVAIGPREAISASGIEDAARVRLIQRSDGPVYVVSGRSRLKSIRASDAADATVKSPHVALAEAKDHARKRGLDISYSSFVELADYDQWNVPNGFDRHRPLFRVALNDAAGTEVYVSSITGEIVLDTTRSERWWNFLGSVVHWIYPAILRKNWSLWDNIVWTLSLLAAVAATLGTVLGIARIKIRDKRVVSPYRGWHAQHHVLGLISTVFVLTWIFSGWLSMDHGRLFSRGQLTDAEANAAEPTPAWSTLPAADWKAISPAAREVEWFAFDRNFYRRDRIGLDRQTLFGSGDSRPGDRSGFLNSREIQALIERLASGCSFPAVVAADDNYVASSTILGAPVYRSVCGDVWFDVDGASGIVLQRLDSSRRAYRWLYSALHTLDFPILVSHPRIRSTLIVSLCVCGLLFSVTGLVIGWRRLRYSVLGKVVGVPGKV